MKLLAVDTATRTCSVALCEENRLLLEITADYPLTHAHHLMTMIHDVLDRSMTGLDEVDAFAVTVGPGSFTGLRIGVSTVKGLASALAKPLAGVSSLEVLAHSYAGTSDLVSPWIDARKQEVYTAAYRWIGGEFITVLPQRVSPPREILGSINETCIFVGNGAEQYADLIHAMRGDSAVIAPPALNRIRASLVADLGFRRISESLTAPPGDAQPLYIRRSDAEIRPKRVGSTC